MEVEKFLHDAQEVLVLTLTLVECFSTLRRIQLEGGIAREEYLLSKKEISHEFSFFSAIDPSDVLSLCESLIDSHLLKTLDSIQLASALACKASNNRSPPAVLSRNTANLLCLKSGNPVTTV